jgi:hypothetical protein
MGGAIDVLRRLRRPSSTPTEYYQRPHTYSIAVGLTPVCISPNRQHNPAITLLVQADLANGGIINVGDSGISLTVGLQLDSGKAALFAPQMNPSNQPGSLGTGITSFIENIPYDASGAIPQSLGTELGIGLPVQVVLDIADFWAIADRIDQRLRIFWVDQVRIPSRAR